MIINLSENTLNKPSYFRIRSGWKKMTNNGEGMTLEVRLDLTLQC